MDEMTIDIPCLRSFVDLEKQCAHENLSLSDDTNRYMLIQTFRRLGAASSHNLIKELVQKGDIKWNDDENFEVEAVVDYVKEKIKNKDNPDEEIEQELYLVKWKGWSCQHNTWEPKEHLNCPELIEEFHGTNQRKKRKLEITEVHEKRQQVIDILDQIISVHKLTPVKLLGLSFTAVSNKSWEHRLQELENGRCSRARMLPRQAATINRMNKRTNAYKLLHNDMMKQLRQWEVDINGINTDTAPINVENLVDLEGPPTTFTYINDYKPMDGIEIPTDPIVGCECTDCFDDRKQCCGPKAGTEVGYRKNRKVRVLPGTPVYECNKRCQCGPECFNRVVQHGRKHRVCIFRTDNCRGWGVKALQKIPKGSFVMEYVGEVITFDEAEKRGKQYDAEGMTYLFDLDYAEEDCVYTVDARTYGNVSHFVNHSCDPNLVVYGVWINHLDHRLPRIALFAARNIAKYEELTFDYMMTGAVHGDNSQVEKEAAAGTSPEKTSSVSTMKMSSPFKKLSTPLQAADSGLPSPVKDAFSLFRPIQNSCSTPLKEANVNLDVTPISMDGHLTPNKENLTTDLITQADALIHSVPPTPRESNASEQAQVDGKQLVDAADSAAFSRRHKSSPPAMRYRIMCQCGTAKCRKWLY